MRLDDLMEYDKIVGWGAGQAFVENYGKRIHLDYIVEKDKKKVGTTMYGIPVYPISVLKENERSEKVLIIIFAARYQDEIIDEIKEMSINCDYIGIEEYSRLFGFLANNYFAGYGVDANVIEVLERTGYKIEKMNYIEIGATHPILGSATYAMYLKGARGVLVEPNPDCISEMKRLRPDDICLNCGVGAENETLKFYRFDNKYRNSFDISVVNENIGKGYKLIDEIDIEVKTLETIIDESGLDVSSTYISLQVLGLEYEILRKFDYKKYNFPIIRVACYDERVKELDIFKDYIEVARVARHSILVKKEVNNQVFEISGC